MEEIFKKLEDKGFEVVVGYREKQRKKDMSEAMKKIKNRSLTNSRGSRVAGPQSRSRVQCRGRGSKVAVAGPMSRQGKMIWGSR